MKKSVNIFIIILLLLNINIKIIKAEDFDITSKEAILYNLNDNKILYELDKDKKVEIASITKIMTTIVAIENIENIDEEVTLGYNIFNGLEGYSKAGFKIGDKVTYRDLLYGIMLPSGADAVNGIILNITNSKEEFIDLMNNKAKELELTNTHFDNAIGMDSEDGNISNYSTASDIATLLIYSLNNKIFKEIFTNREYIVPSNNLKLKSTLTTYGAYGNLDISNIKGAKSGFTDGAGLCLASIATINNVDYLLITLGAQTNNRFNAIKDSIAIYDYYSNNYSYKKILTKDKLIKNINVKWSNIDKYSIRGQNDIEMYLKNDVNLDDIKYIYEGLEELTPKNKLGEKIGKIKILYNDEVLATSDVYLDIRLKYSKMFLFLLLIPIFIIMLLFSKKKKKT